MNGLLLLAVAGLAGVASSVPTSPVPKPAIVWKPIPFGAKRRAETVAYARRHYGLDRWSIVGPHVIVEHISLTDSLSAVYSTFGPDVPDVDFAVLYESAWELVLLERWAPGISIAVPIPGGIELLVLDGSFAEGGEEFIPLSWLRLPAGAMLQATAGQGGCKLWVKSGRLAHGQGLPTAA